MGSKEFVVEYTAGKSKRVMKQKLRLGDIVSEFQLMETPDFDVISQCIRGALAIKTGKEYEQIHASSDEVDKAILMLTAQRIVSLERSFNDLRIAHGRHWVPAIAAARFWPVAVARTAGKVPS